MYISHGPDSDIDGISVHKARELSGVRLAIDNPVEADIVAAVPDSARPAAMGYAEQSGIPYKKALAKNRYVGRTFIQPRTGKKGNRRQCQAESAEAQCSR